MTRNLKEWVPEPIEQTPVFAEMQTHEASKA